MSRSLAETAASFSPPPLSLPGHPPFLMPTPPPPPAPHSPAPPFPAGLSPPPLPLPSSAWQPSWPQPLPPCPSPPQVGSPAGEALLEPFKPRPYSETIGGMSIAAAGCIPILHMRHFQQHKQLSGTLVQDILTRGRQ